MPFPLDPMFQETGVPFIEAPDGTTVPDNEGAPVDISNTPLFVAPQTNAEQSGCNATVAAFGDEALILTGLTNMAADSVGRFIVLEGTNPANRGTFEILAVLGKTVAAVHNAAGVFPDTNSGATATISAFASNQLTLTGLSGLTDAMVGREITLNGCANVGNNGTFQITKVLSATSCKVFDKTGSFPDANSGAISWTENVVPICWTELVDPNAFAPGDPLSNVAARALPLTQFQTVDGPATGGGAEILGPQETITDPVLDPELEGKNFPRVAPTAPTTGDVVFTDPQNPVREVPSSTLLVNHDLANPAFGLQPILADGPAVQTPSIVNGGTEPAVRSEPVGGNVLYPSSNPVVFSKGP